MVDAKARNSKPNHEERWLFFLRLLGTFLISMLMIMLGHTKSNFLN